jgi:hypothetical protein
VPDDGDDDDDAIEPFRGEEKIQIFAYGFCMREIIGGFIRVKCMNVNKQDTNFKNQKLPCCKK